MRVVPLVLAVTLSTLAGCAVPSPAPEGAGADEPATATSAPGASEPAAAAAAPCVSPEETRSVYDAADRFGKTLSDLAFHMRIEGRQAGERVDGLMSVSPEDDMLRMRGQHDGQRYEYRVVGDLYSMDTPEGAGWGRNYEAGAMFAQIHAELMKTFSTDQPNFADEHGVEDYAVECGEIAGVRVLTFTVEENGKEESVVVERDAPNRPVSFSVVDETLDDRNRISMSYDVPDVTIDQTETRLGAQIHFDVVEYTANERGGIYMVGRLNELTHWVPISDLTLRLMEDELLVKDAETPLRPGLLQLDEGDRFRFTDTDQNGMVSDGDVFVMDFTPGHDFSLYDRWAAAPVRLGARSADTPAEPGIVAPEDEPADAPPSTATTFA